jgi:hypothetical protein
MLLNMARHPGSPQSSWSPMLPFVHFDLPVLLQQVVSRHFPDMEATVSASFMLASLSRTESLASVRVGGRTAEIRIHEILNRSDTPREVIEFILSHEALHVRVPPREIDGRPVKHPPEFWEAETRLFPERSIVWAWLYAALWPRIKFDKKRESTMVKRGWQNASDRRFPSLEDARAITKADAEMVRYL